MQEHSDPNEKYVRRHLKFGWWCLLAFLSLGIVLETFHGFKVGWYLDVTNETRRLMWTLAHTHGTLMGLINIGFGVTLHVLSVDGVRCGRIASPSLLAAGILLPGGFFLGGVVVYAGDPSLGILLVPVGAALLVVGVLVTALSINDTKRRLTTHSPARRHKTPPVRYQTVIS